MIINKPWGHEKIWTHTENYIGKILVIEEGKMLSLQHHEEKEESILILKGLLKVLYGDSPDEAKENEPKVLSKGDALHIPPGKVHRFIAEKDTVVFEVSTSHMEDVVRHEDEYGRLDEKKEDK